MAKQGGATLLAQTNFTPKYYYLLIIIRKTTATQLIHSSHESKLINWTKMEALSMSVRGSGTARRREKASGRISLSPLRPNSDLSQTSHCNINGLSVNEVMRIENMITQVKFY